MGPVPVAVIGLALYSANFVASIVAHPAAARFLPEGIINNVLERCLLIGTTAAAGAGIWFIILQVFVVRRFCRYCNIVHVLGIAAAGLAAKGYADNVPMGSMMVASLIAASVLVALQMLLPVRTYSVIPTDVAVSNASTTPDLGAQANVPPADKGNLDEAKPQLIPRRRVALAGGSVRFYTDEWPLCGNVDAKQVVILLYDQTCKTCRQMRRTVLEAVESSDGELAALLISVPQDPRCNPLASPKRSESPDADPCQFARLLFLLHSVAPHFSHEFERWLASFPDPTPPPLDAAVRRAQRLERVPWPPPDEVDAKLRAAVSLFRSAAARQVPTLVLERSAIVGVVPSAEKLLGMISRAQGAGPTLRPTVTAAESGTARR